MTYACPRGHASADADYCSVCGLRIGAAPLGGSANCPVCTTPQVPGARYCEVCRYDFQEARSSDPANIGAEAPAAPAPAPVTGNLWARVTAVRSLLSPESKDLAFPDGEPERVYPLDLDESLVGRRNARPGIYPEIPVNDPGASGRHLKICRRRGGGLYLVDVGSSNGTQVNGAAVSAGVETELHPGDIVLIGAWTKILIEAR